MAGDEIQKVEVPGGAFNDNDPQKAATNPTIFKIRPSLLLGLTFFILLLVGIGYLANQNSILKRQAIIQPTVYPIPGKTTPTIVIPSPTIGPLSVTPTEIPNNQVIKVSLASTEGWQEVKTYDLSLKLPPEAIFKKNACNWDYEECYLVNNHLKTPFNNSQLSISIKTYKGGSRRQEAHLDAGSAENYKITEKLFDNNDALDMYFNCQINECTSLREIVLVVGNKLIHISDGITYEDKITNSIVASISSEKQRFSSCFPEVTSLSKGNTWDAFFDYAGDLVILQKSSMPLATRSMDKINRSKIKILPNYQDHTYKGGITAINNFDIFVDSNLVFPNFNSSDIIVVRIPKSEVDKIISKTPSTIKSVSVIYTDSGGFQTTDGSYCIGEPFGYYALMSDSRSF